MDKFAVDSQFAGRRADIFIANHFPEFSRASLKGLFEMQKVFLGERPIKPSYKLKTGDIISVDSAQLRIRPKKLKLPVIYEDKDVIVVNKPAGILTHSKGALNFEPSVATFISSKLNDKKLKGNRAGIVHRLDRLTSGLIICAKNERALKYLQRQFSNRLVKKSYLAIVEGTPSPAAAIIDAPIGRNPKRPQTFKVMSDGKPAVTVYTLLRKLNKSRICSEVELQPETGRTHQIRVHMAYIGHPLIGDKVYGHNTDKMFLHAQKLKLHLPNGKSRIFRASISNDFAEFIK